MDSYNLPKSTFVDSVISFALAYGYFVTTDANSTESYVVVPDCGYCFFTLSVLKLERNRVTLLYTSVTDALGGRDFSNAMINAFMQSDPRKEKLEEPLAFLRLRKGIEKPKCTLCSGSGCDDSSLCLVVPDTNVTVDSVFGDNEEGDVDTTLTAACFDAECESEQLFDRFRQSIAKCVAVALCIPIHA